MIISFFEIPKYKKLKNNPPRIKIQSGRCSSRILSETILFSPSRMMTKLLINTNKNRAPKRLHVMIPAYIMIFFLSSDVFSFLWWKEFFISSFWNSSVFFKFSLSLSIIKWNKRYYYPLSRSDIYLSFRFRHILFSF